MPKSNKPKGFTLMEMLVVIIIIAIVSSIGTNNYREQRRQVKYNDSVSYVLGMIKKARNYAITSRPVYDETMPADQESYVPEEGYGVYIERSEDSGASRAVLFANTEFDEDFEADQFDSQALGSTGDDLIEEEYFFDLEVDFTEILEDLTPTPAAEDSIVVIYKPPLAEASLSVNIPNPVALDQLSDLYLGFKRQGVPAAVPPQYIHINRVSGIAEIVRP